jgi:hypothetical protein
MRLALVVVAAVLIVAVSLASCQRYEIVTGFRTVTYRLDRWTGEVCAVEADKDGPWVRCRGR